MFNKLTILGAGTMGCGIAQFFARNKVAVRLYDIKPDMLVVSRNRMNDHAGIAKYLTYTTKLEEAVSDADFIIESVPEDIKVKRQLYSEMEPFLNKAAIISSNTSTFPLALLSFSQSFSDRMIITHFFNPPQLIPLVEIIQAENTELGLVDKVVVFLRNYGKVPVVLKKDIHGFVANRLQAAVLREACFLVRNGVVDIQGIDSVMTEGIGIRWAFNGPFRIADLGGLDIWDKVCTNLLPELCNEKESPEILEAKVKRGAMGLKTGEGFYKYDGHSHDEHITERKLIELLSLKKMMSKM